ncbi:protein SHQ1 homolog [Anopheles ziemanni]|uniref:protein SHQ1 homolog n=1 Tax=Anopheles coustani TaxID=139045 RepID=UPI002658ED71|nr:protein SHQ1 homolog [Anopheles coustani]XP_058174085.1 protein SHQ1 homolog [Anopheles ziemanni]
MSDSVKFSISLDPKHAVVILEVPELDVEHESNLVLDVYPRECIFTAAPYHARITLDADVTPGKAFPDKIDYEKNTVTFRIPLESVATKTEPPKNLFHYGFGQLYHGPLVLESSQELRMLAHPELYSLTDRMQLMRKAEVKDFQCEHYGMDHIQFQIDKLGLTLEGSPSAPKLSDDQSYRIRVIVEEKQRQPELYTAIEDHRAILLGLIDILLAICYDRLTNGNELNEANSHINIQRISATLSFFVEFDSVEELLRSFYRRSCTYPFYRNKEISKACVNRLLTSAESFNIREWIKHELMFAYDAFKATDCAVMNHYYVKDYLRYLELALNDKLLEECLKDLEKLLAEVHQESLGFGEDETVQQLLMEIMGEEDSDSTDSDDSDSNDDEVGSSDSEADSVVEDENPNENVLEKLMNLKLSG